MLKIIKNGKIYAPEYVGEKEILISGDKIAALADSISLIGVDYETIDAEGRIVVPGFIDQHVHVTGGGGQDGFASLIPEVEAKDLTEAGTTTVVGLLGTDGFVKELTTLYAKTKALDTKISAYMFTSFYGLPEKTLMGSVAMDMIFIDKVIGCKLAISDDRSSFPTEQEILRLLNQVRLGGFTSHKVGVLHIHVGALESGIEVLINIAKKYPTFIPYMSPTHLIRTKELFKQAAEFAKLGGMIDISTGGTKFTDPHKAVGFALEAGVPLANITFSSDGRGGVKRIDPITGEQTYKPAPLNLSYLELVKLVTEKILPLEKALTLATTNPAKNLKLRHKARIEKGYDADMLMLDSSYNITAVMAKGELIKT